MLLVLGLTKFFRGGVYGVLLITAPELPLGHWNFDPVAKVEIQGKLCWINPFLYPWRP